MKAVLSEAQNHYPFKHRYYGHVKYILILPVYLLLFFLQEQMLPMGDSVNFISYIPIDDKIPFIESFVIPYVAWYPFLVLTGLYLMFRDVSGFKKYMLYIAVSYYSVIILFAFFKTGQELRPETFERDNIFTAAVGFLYSIDTSTNVCPSVHVIGSFAPIFAALHCKYMKKPIIPIVFIVIAAFITASTVLIKQHSMLDVIVAIPWALVSYIIVYVLPKLFKKK